MLFFFSTIFPTLATALSVCTLIGLTIFARIERKNQVAADAQTQMSLLDLKIAETIAQLPPPSAACIPKVSLAGQLITDALVALTEAEADIALGPAKALQRAKSGLRQVKFASELLGQTPGEVAKVAPSF